METNTDAGLGLSEGAVSAGDSVNYAKMNYYGDSISQVFEVTGSVATADELESPLPEIRIKELIIICSNNLGLPCRPMFRSER